MNGKDVPVSVLLVHPGQGDPSSVGFASQMKAAMIKAFSERQIVIYEGHAGPLYGFALANWNVTEAGELDDSELPSLSIPENFYQVVLASGCDTYMVADALYENPVKQGRIDLDVITTSSFSNAAGKGRTAKVLVDAVVNQKQGGQLAPQMFGQLLRDLNQEYWMTPIYGVHGIDDNPRVNPFADVSKLCTELLRPQRMRRLRQSLRGLRRREHQVHHQVRDEQRLPGRLQMLRCARGRHSRGKELRAHGPGVRRLRGRRARGVDQRNPLRQRQLRHRRGSGARRQGRTDLTGYSLVFYNGKPGQLRAYKSVTIEDQLPGSGGIGILWLPVANLQNGGADGSPEPDGIALVDAHGTVLSFISYEGAFTPTNGPAAGMQSVDIGVSELSTSPEGQSLSLTGTGKTYSAFTWTTGPASPGGMNPGQSFQ